MFDHELVMSHIIHEGGMPDGWGLRVDYPDSHIRATVIPTTYNMAPKCSCPGNVSYNYFWKCIGWDCEKCPFKHQDLYPI